MGKLHKDELAVPLEEFTVPVRETTPKPVPGEPESFTRVMFMKNHVGDGEINGDKFTLCVGFNGWLEVIFGNGDDDCFVLSAGDFVTKAHEAWLARRDSTEEDTP